MLVVDNEFILENKGLIHHLIKKSGRKLDREEEEGLFVDVVIKLLQNAKWYNPSFSLGTYIGLQVKSAVAEFVDKEVNSEDALSLADSDEVPEEAYEDEQSPLEEMQDRVAPYLKYLSTIEKEVFTDRVYKGIPVHKIASHRGLHAKSVSRMIHRSVGKLKGYVSKSRRMNPMQETSTGAPLRHAIKRTLNDRDYFIFKLTYFDGLTPYQVSLRNGMSPKQVRDMAPRIRNQVRELHGVY